MTSCGDARTVNVEKNARERSPRFSRMVSTGEAATFDSPTFHRDGIPGYRSSSSRSRAAFGCTPTIASRWIV